MLAAHLEDATVVVELGAWLGLSSRFILGRCPGALLVSVDNFSGGSDLECRKQIARLRDKPEAIYRYRCWPFRDRLTVLRMDMGAGLRAVRRVGLSPSLVYIDGDHGYESALCDAILAGVLFPNANLVGDDWAQAPVKQAARDVAEILGRRLTANDRAWAMAPKTAPEEPRPFPAHPE